MLGRMKVVGFVPSRNPGKARSFYEKVLGLRFVSEDQFAFVFDANGVPLRVVNVAAVPDFEPAPFTILGWQVPDIRKAVTTLQRKGVNFERYEGMALDDLGIWTSPSGAKVAWFKDPDGNVLSVSEQ
ncbi:MAG: VOC family protein [Nitrososphaerales archaeon]|nr:VOC family protein [Nitrososphaerales archaeon]